MDVKMLDTKYVDSSLLNALLEKRIDSELDFLSVLATMKEKARVEFNKSQENKESVNSEESIIAHAEYEVLNIVETLAKEYLRSNG